MTGTRSRRRLRVEVALFVALLAVLAGSVALVRYSITGAAELRVQDVLGGGTVVLLARLAILGVRRRRAARRDADDARSAGAPSRSADHAARG